MGESDKLTQLEKLELTAGQKSRICLELGEIEHSSSSTQITRQIARNYATLLAYDGAGKAAEVLKFLREQRGKIPDYEEYFPQVTDEELMRIIEEQRAGGRVN
jgi:hypothetical protein